MREPRTRELIRFGVNEFNVYFVIKTFIRSDTGLCSNLLRPSATAGHVHNSTIYVDADNVPAINIVSITTFQRSDRICVIITPDKRNINHHFKIIVIITTNIPTYIHTR